MVRSPYSLPVSKNTLISSRSMMDTLYRGLVRQHILEDSSPVSPKTIAEQTQDYSNFLASDQGQLLLTTE